MQLSLTNNTEQPEVVGDPEGSWVDVLNPGTPFTMQNDLQVIVIGDKPTVREQFQQAADVVGALVRKVVQLVQGRKVAAQDAERTESVSVTILNRGQKAVRVILGDGVTDKEIAPCGSALCSAAGYVEVRELGDLSESQVDGGTQPAVA